MPNRLLLIHHRIRPRRVLLTVLVAVFAAEACVMLLLPNLLPAGTSVWSNALVDACLLTILLAPALWWLVVRPVRQQAEVRQRLLAMVLSAQETERQRIARDLHDGLGQSITGLLVGLRAIEESTADEKVKSLAQQLRRLGGETHDEIRCLARGLRPAVLDDAGLAPALERFVADLQATRGVQARLDLLCGEPPRLSGEIETALYRIVQEATNNAIRHGHASEITVTIECDQQQVRLTIADNGCGFEPAEVLRKPRSDGSLGLCNIRERAWLLGGTTIIESTRGSGSRIEVRLPFAKD